MLEEEELSSVVDAERSVQLDWPNWMGVVLSSLA